MELEALLSDIASPTLDLSFGIFRVDVSPVDLDCDNQQQRRRCSQLFGIGPAFGGACCRCYPYRARRWSRSGIAPSPCSTTDVAAPAVTSRPAEQSQVTDTLR
jgi:hypothetical protein